MNPSYLGAVVGLAQASLGDAFPIMVKSRAAEDPTVDPVAYKHDTEVRDRSRARKGQKLSATQRRRAKRKASYASRRANNLRGR